MSSFTIVLAHWRVHWLLLLLPVALFLPALPIDETRYLAVAWEMRLHLDFLVPHLNGATYSQKPPLLFWLINLGWLASGMHAWAVRLGVLFASFATLFLFEQLARRLGADERQARNATWLLLGMIYFALFSSAIMFDVLLTTFALVALHGALDLDAQRWRRGVALLALGFGFGILTKGPVILLDAGLVIALGALWSATARANKARWFGAFGLGVLGGAIIGLAWAIPAAIAGGEDYAHAIFLHQTLDRVTQSFAHRRPLWWYFMVLPLMALPWTIAVRAPWRVWRQSFHKSKSARFGVVLFLPAFAVFCLVSGKQPHYLLPLLPGLALYLAAVLTDERARLRGRPFGIALLLAGIALAALPYLAANPQTFDVLERAVRDGRLTPPFLDVVSGIWPLWGALIALLGCALLVWGRVFATPRALAFSSVAAAASFMLLLAQGVGPTVDVSAAAARIRADHDRGVPIAHLGWHHGLFEFAGRLDKPLEAVTYEHLRAWCEAHPHGEVVSMYTKYPITAKPELELRYRFGYVRFWRAADIVSMPAAAAPVAPDEDETPDD